MRRFTFVHPSGLSLARRSRVEQERFGFPLGFAPRSHPRRTPGRERSIGHWTGSRPRQATTSNRRDHSLRATSRRTAAPSFTNQLRLTSGGVLSPPLDSRRLVAHVVAFELVQHDS